MSLSIMYQCAEHFQRKINLTLIIVMKTILVAKISSEDAVCGTHFQSNLTTRILSL